MNESERKKAAMERFEAACQRFLEGPPPKPKPLPPPAEIIPFNPFPPGRKWTAEPLATVNSVPYQPTDFDRLVELQRDVAQAARTARLSRDRSGWGSMGTKASTI